VIYAESRERLLKIGRPASLTLSAVLLGSAGAATVLAGIQVAIGGTRGFVVAISALLAVVLGVVTLLRPAVGGLILVGVVPVVSGLRRGLPVPGFRLSEILIAYLATIILVTAKPEQRRPWGAFDWVALSYALMIGVFGAYDLLLLRLPFTSDSVGKIASPLQFFLLYRAVATSCTSIVGRRRALRLVLFTSVPLAVLGILQELNVGSIRTFLTRITGVKVGDVSLDPGFVLGSRATGPFPQWHTFGGYLFLTILLGVGLLLKGSRDIASKKTIALILVVCIGALFATLTVTPIVATLVGVVLLGAWTRTFGRILVLLGVGAVLAVAVFGTKLEHRYDTQLAGLGAGTSQLAAPQTLSFRLQVWKDQYLPLLHGRALATGYGPVLPPDFGITWQYTESIYLTMLLKGGIPLLLMYCLLMFVLAARARRVAYENDHDRQILGRVVFVAIILLVFMHLVSAYFLTSGLPHLLWAMAGLLYAGSISAQRRLPSPSGHPALRPSGAIG
jgi:hypothetical protein